MGAYHTIELELNRKFTLAKKSWDSILLERIGKELLLLVFDRDLSEFHLVTTTQLHHCVFAPFKHTNTHFSLTCQPYGQIPLDTDLLWLWNRSGYVSILLNVWASTGCGCAVAAPGSETKTQSFCLRCSSALEFNSEQFAQAQNETFGLFST